MSDQRTILGRRVRGLTIQQPNNWAILHAGKPVENRGRHAPLSLVGHWIALHAGLTWDHDNHQRMLDGVYGSRATDVPFTAPRGVITGLAILQRTDDLIDVRAAGELTPWHVGPLCHVLAHVTPIEPVPCVGAQGFWYLPDDVFARVNEQMAAKTYDVDTCANAAGCWLVEP